jgi:trans-aconitate 2-methyltransferase
MTMRWDPAQYGLYADQRSRPFFDLIARIGAASPRTVVDLGCGTGELTVSLAQRWPGASVQGIDSSADMIDQAPRGQGVEFMLGTAQEFDATGTDVLVSNALLQWVPGHDALLIRWAEQLARDGWLAFQVPANFSAPSHRLMRHLAASPRWQRQLSGVLRDEPVAEPPQYLDLLATRGLEVEAWQTEYQHVLQGPDPVLEWVRGTALRPVLSTLSGDEAAEFSAEYAVLLREAYPPRPYGTVFGFLRTFVVAHKP